MGRDNARETAPVDKHSLSRAIWKESDINGVPNRMIGLGSIVNARPCRIQNAPTDTAHPRRPLQLFLESHIPMPANISAENSNTKSATGPIP